MAILANLDKHLEDASWKLLKRSPSHIRRYTPEQVITNFGIDFTAAYRCGLVCRECHTPLQSDDLKGICESCYRPHR